MTIPAAVVDDEEIDRYAVRRALKRDDRFGEFFEFPTGRDFLDGLESTRPAVEPSQRPLLVLMDVNMPRMTGFEAAAELERLIQSGNCVDAIVMMMLTSSNNVLDQQAAEQIDIVQGYILKPLGTDDLDTLVENYETLSETTFP